jgi:hypothetical protein
MRDAFAEAVFAGEGKEEVAGWIEGFLWRFERGEELDERDDKNEKVKGESTGDGDMVEDEAKEVDSLAEKTDGVQLDET